MYSLTNQPNKNLLNNHDWSHLHFNQFGVGPAERVEGEKSCFVPKRFIEYILKLLYAHTDPANEEEKKCRQELFTGIQVKGL